MYEYLQRLSRGQQYFLLALLLVPMFYAYNPFPLYFLNDDFIHVPLSQQGVWGQRNSIRPVSDVSIYLDSLMWGNNAAGYHLTNLVFHLLNVVAVYYLALLFFKRFKYDGDVKLLSAVAAVFFAGYAFHSEGVLWIIGRGSVISTMLLIICIIIFLSVKRQWFYYLISYTCFLLGLLTYESIIVLLPVLIILSLFYKDLRKKQDIILIFGYFPVFIYYLFLRIKWTGSLTSEYDNGAVNHPSIIIGNFVKLVLRSFAAPQINSTVFAVTSIFILLAIIVFFKAQIKRLQLKTLSCITLLFLVSYLPYLTLGIDTHGVESERYLYMPSVFLCMFLVFLLASFRNKKVAAGILVLYFAYNQYYLLKSAKAFVISSDIASKTISMVKANPSVHTIYFKNLPQENYGVPIFRLGLEEGVRWQIGESKKIVVVSKNSNEKNVFEQKLNVTHKVDSSKLNNDNSSLIIQYIDREINVSNTH